VAERLSAEARLDALILCEPQVPTTRDAVASCVAALRQVQQPVDTSRSGIGLLPAARWHARHPVYPVRKRRCSVGWHKAVSPFTRVLTVQKRCAIGGGCCANPLSYTRHGFEMHMGVNHFGYAALVDALLPKLKSQVKARFRPCPAMSDLMHGNVKLGSEHPESPVPCWIVFGNAEKRGFLATVTYAKCPCTSGLRPTQRMGTCAGAPVTCGVVRLHRAPVAARAAAPGRSAFPSPVVPALPRLRAKQIRSHPVRQ